MKITIDIDQEVLANAQAVTEVKEYARPIHDALNVLIVSESAAKLAELSGYDPDLNLVPRRKTEISLTS